MFAYYLVDFDPFIFRLWDNIGPRWYGLAYVLAFGFAYWVYRYLARRGYADLSPDKVADFVLGNAIFGVLLGAPTLKLRGDDRVRDMYLPRVA